MAKLDNLNLERKRRQNRYFSENFKKIRVKEYEQNLVTVAEISREYMVTRAAVYKWIYKYSRNLKRETKQVIELKSDTKKIAALKKKIKELERIVGEKQIMIDFKDKMIEIAEEEFKINIKKKYGSDPYSFFGDKDDMDTK